MTTATAMVVYPLAAAIMDRAITTPITVVITAGTMGITIPGTATMFTTVEANAIDGITIIADTGRDVEMEEPAIMGSALAASALTASINGMAAGVTAITATAACGRPGAHMGTPFGNRGAVWEAPRARSLGSSTNSGALVRTLSENPTE